MNAPYYADEAVTLYCGDFRELLPQILAEHGEPDLTLTDPPYSETALTWDHWPGGWPQLIPGRSMWCFGSMRMFLDRRDDFTGWRMSQDVVWEKNTGSSFVADRFRRVHEHALHFYRGPWGDVHHQTPRIPWTGRDRGRAVLKRGNTPHTGEIGSHGWEDDGTRLQPSVVYAANMHQRAINETEKPESVLVPLLAYGCPPGGLVLDPFAGSCSTLVAARHSGRRAVGIELREEQCAKAVEHRLSQAVLPFGTAS